MSGGTAATLAGSIKWVKMRLCADPTWESSNETRLRAGIGGGNVGRRDRRHGHGTGGKQTSRARAIDANQDGEISSSEIDGAAAALKKLDKNGDGKLTREELVPAGGPGGDRSGGGGREAFLERLRQADKDGDGKLSKDEAPERLQGVFDRIDADGDRQLDREELRAIGRRLRERDQ